MGVILLGVLCRTFVAATGWFYWDDLTLHAQARDFGSPTLELLLRNHDGHLMPGAWFIEWVLATAAPLSWPAAVVTLIVLQLAAAAAVAWAGRVVWPGQLPGQLEFNRVSVPGAAVPVALYLFMPLTLPSTTWLATAVNILPLHLAFAMVLGHAVLALRSRALRHQFFAAGWLVVGLLFSERALFLGPTVILMLCCFAFVTRSLREHGRSIGQLAVILTLPTIVWTVLYLVVIGDPREVYTPAIAVGEEAASGVGTGVGMLLSHGYFQGLLPTLGGGPWHWERWHPGPPWAAPTTFAVLAGCAALIALALWTARRGLRALVAWMPALLYPLVPLAALALARTNPNTAVEISQTLRHFSEAAVLGAVTLAFLGSLPTPRPAPPWLRWLAPVALVAVLVSSLFSTVTYTKVWADQPARDYFQNLRADLAEREEPIFDQAVGLDVLLPVVHPHNQLSKLIGGLAGVPPITHHTGDLVFVDDAGRLQPAALSTMRSTVPGQDPECGTRVGPGGATLPLDGPLVDRDWVVLLNYFADAAGTATLHLDGDPVDIPVEAGLNQVYAQISGGGTELGVTPGNGTTELCVGTSDLGVPVPAG